VSRRSAARAAAYRRELGGMQSLVSMSELGRPHEVVNSPNNLPSRRHAGGVKSPRAARVGGATV